MVTTDYNNTASSVIENGISATAIAFLSESMKEMIPCIIVAILLILLN